MLDSGIRVFVGKRKTIASSTTNVCIVIIVHWILVAAGGSFFVVMSLSVRSISIVESLSFNSFGLTAAHQELPQP